MGHTLVTRFDSQGLTLLHSVMDPFRIPKIPFGRSCDRDAANSALDYHVTLFHWAKAQDALYLNRLQSLRSFPCRLQVTGAEIMYAEEGSLLLYLAVEPDEGFQELTCSVEETLQAPCSRFLHITLAVSQSHEEIRSIHSHLLQSLSFPFRLNVEGLDLYHIWTPTKKVRSL